MVVVSLTFYGMIFLTYVDYSKIVDYRMLVGTTYMELDKSFFQVINNEITKTVEANGDLIITLDGCLDSDRQNEEIDYLISQNVDLLIINPVDANQVKPALRRAKDAGIPIVLVDSTVDDASLYDVAVISDNYEAGKICAQYLETQLATAKILILEHTQVLSAVNRIDGFKDTIATNPNYQVLDSLNCLGQTDLSYNLVRAYLANNPDVDAIMALNDTSALGALAAVENAGLNINVYGVDGSPDIKKLLATNDNIQASAGQSPIKMGQEAISYGYELTANKEVPAMVKIDVDLITKDNVEDYNILGWQ